MGLEHGREAAAGLAAEAQVGAAVMAVAGKHRRPIAARRGLLGQHVGVDEREVGALPQLRAHAVGAVADGEHAAIVPALHPDVGVAGFAQLAGVVQSGHHGRGRWEEFNHLALEAVEAGRVAPAAQLGERQAPEEVDAALSPAGAGDPRASDPASGVRRGSVGAVHSAQSPRAPGAPSRPRPREGARAA